MTNKNLVMLVSAAVVLGGAAYFLGNGTKGTAPKLNGKTILPGFNAADVAKIEIGGKLTLAADDTRELSDLVVEDLFAGAFEPVHGALPSSFASNFWNESSFATERDTTSALAPSPFSRTS